MAFINDYLTQEEKERFEEYNIMYSEESSYSRRKVGVGSGRKSCTLDREHQMYLFQSINTYNRQEFGETTEYFTFVFVKEGKASVMYVNLEEDRSTPYEERDYDILWELKGYEMSKTNGYTEEELMGYFKEAMCAYGSIGSVKKLKFNVKFNF